MILEKLKSRKTKHVTKVRDHIMYLHSKLNKNSLELNELKGKELNTKVKKIQAIGSRMKQYRKHLNMILF
jgi:aspartokinase